MSFVLNFNWKNSLFEITTLMKFFSGYLIILKLNIDKALLNLFYNVSLLFYICTNLNNFNAIYSPNFSVVESGSLQGIKNFYPHLIYGSLYNI